MIFEIAPPPVAQRLASAAAGAFVERVVFGESLAGVEIVGARGIAASEVVVAFGKEMKAAVLGARFPRVYPV